MPSENQLEFKCPTCGATGVVDWFDAPGGYHVGSLSDGFELIVEGQATAETSVRHLRCLTSFKPADLARSYTSP